MNTPAFNFSDPELVAKYIERGPRAFMPGQPAVLQMAGLLLAERVAEDGHILVVGAGGGMDTQALASTSPYWRFTGVDPSATMLDLARHVLGEETLGRVALIEGGVEAAPDGPFDGATLILVLGILPDDGSKLTTLKDIRRRLKPGAPFILVDRCDSADNPRFDRNMDRYVAFAGANGVDPETLKNARASHRGNPGLVPPERDEALMAEAGFGDIEHFYHAMNWHGWVAYAA